MFPSIFIGNVHYSINTCQLSIPRCRSNLQRKKKAINCENIKIFENLSRDLQKKEANGNSILKTQSLKLKTRKDLMSGKIQQGTRYISWKTGQ